MSESWNDHRIKWERIDQMTLIRKERRRLQKAISEQPDNPYWQWMKKWLAQYVRLHSPLYMAHRFFLLR